ncbi:TPA: hypothetical protein DCQ22_03900 [Candidatus Nomurabacteria bacterium]|nr:hypothetical protein [Candidatus Nomurabacteria bacterium]
MIVIKHRGNFNNTEKFLNGAKKIRFVNILEKYAREGVSALSDATPIDTSLTSNSWDFEITVTKNRYAINWINSNVVDGVPIAIILQYGHGTKNGGYVQGRDYINPALLPILDKLSENLWKEVTKL